MDLLHEAAFIILAMGVVFNCIVLLCVMARLYLTAKSYCGISRPLLVFELSLCGTGYNQIHLEARAHIEVRCGDGPSGP